MLIGVLLVIGVVLLLSFQQPGLGVLFAVGMGFLQDPLRKLTPEQPPWMVTLSAIVVVVAFAGVLAKGGRPAFPTSDLRRSGSAFLFVVALQTLVALARGRPLLVTIVGGASYVLPLIAAWMGFVYARRPSRIVRTFTLYVFAGAISGATVFLAVAGFEPPLLRPLGQLFIYGRGAVELPSGILRAPEIASWHAAIAACLAVVLGLRRRPSVWRGAAIGGLLGLLTLAVFLTGRRKGLVLIALFFLFFWWFSRVAGDTSGVGGWLGIVLMVGVLTLSALFQARVFDEKEDFMETLAMRNRDFGEHTRDRATGLFGSMPLLVRSAGVMGAGVGAMAQGSQYLGGAAEAAIVSESGPARVVGELGIPGALIFVWLIRSYGKLVWKSVPAIRRLPTESRVLTAGTAGILCTSAMVFLSAHQIFGDPFVYVFLGLCGGILVGLAQGGLARAGATARQVFTQEGAAWVAVQT